MMKATSSELIAILAVGIALAGVTLSGLSGIHARMDRMEARIDVRFDELDERLSGQIADGDGRLFGRMDDVEARLSSVEENVTRLDALDIGPRLRALEAGQAALREAVARIEGLMRGLLERLSRDDQPAG